jgi:hypothetical protein
MQYLYVRNWATFQHYKYRNPPWIKLHREILTSTDWVSVDDASKLLAIVCMIVGAKDQGRVPNDPAFLKRIAYLDKLPNLKPLIECGFLTETLADASKREQLRTNAPTESRVQSSDTDLESKKVDDDVKKNGKGDKKTKPQHLQQTRDGKRLWCDQGTSEWVAYLNDFKAAHSGVDPKIEWNGAGAWFNTEGEIRMAKAVPK